MPGSMPRIGDRERRARHHHAAREQAREHALDAARDAAQDAVVDGVERQADELRDQQARIRAADLQRAGRAQRAPAGRSSGSMNCVVMSNDDLDRRGQHEERGDRPRRIRRAPAMASRAEPIADQPRRAHHDLLVVRARHLVLSGPIGNGQA